MGSEEELLEVLSRQEGGMMKMENQLTLTTRRVTTQKSNHLIQMKESSPDNERLTDHPQGYQSDSHKRFASLPVTATRLWQENFREP